MYSFSSRLGIARFHNWIPGKVYTPIPLKHVDLHSLYSSVLATFVHKHIDALADHFHVKPVEKKVMNKLLDFTYPERSQVQHARSLHPKQIVTSSSALLSVLYTPNPPIHRILAALNSYPGADQHRQAGFIEAGHLETLINLSMNKSRLCVEVFKMLEVAKLPTTAREKAQYIYQSYRQNLHSADNHGAPDWRAELTRFWPSIVASQDTGALNTLLKLALRARCRETQNLVEYHLQKPNRFTYLTKLKSTSASAAQDVLRLFVGARFVMDLTVFSTFIQKALFSHNKKQVALAEQRFDKLLAKSRGVKPVLTGDVALLLQAMDRANQIINDGETIQLPVIIDAVLFRQMYSHYVNTKNHAAALDVAIAMAQQDEILPRHIIYGHIQDPSVPMEILVQLFYLCCDVNTVHPQFISPSLAHVWAQVIARRNEIPMKEATSLVSESRAAIPM